MSRKIVKFNHDVRDSIREGINILADAVKTTMGPSGKTVLIERPNQHPIVTKDGVTVAKAINLSNQFQNLGVQVVKEAAARSARLNVEINLLQVEDDQKRISLENRTTSLLSECQLLCKTIEDGC